MRHKKIYLFITPIILLVIDRLLKFWAKNGLANNDLLLYKERGGLGLTFVQNTGIAFGLPLGGWLLYIILTVVFIFLIYELYNYWKKQDWHVVIAILLIATGAIGNVIDRLVYGYVIDFIQIFWWPAFNLADVIIIVGVFLWLMLLLRKKE